MYVEDNIDIIARKSSQIGLEKKIKLSADLKERANFVKCKKI